MKKPAMPAMPKIDAKNLDLKVLAEDFKGLDPKDPGAWPLLPRITTLIGLFAALIFAAFWFGWQAQWNDLEAKQQEEARLKNDWLEKKKQAVNLEEHRNQLAEIERSFGALLKQLPNATEMESLLIDINQAGLGRGLKFDLFKPGSTVVHDFYAELPIIVNITGNYHDFGAFTDDIAKLPRIVTLNNVVIEPAGKSGELSLKTTAKTFRYLSDQEVAARQQQAKAAQGGGRK